MKKYFLIPAFLALGAGVFWVSPSWKRLSAAGEEPASSKYVVEAEQRDIDYTIEVSGDVAPELQLEVKSEVGGKIKALHVLAGQKVKKGDLLCEIDDTDLRNERASVMTQIEGAQLSVDRAQLNFDRAKELFARNLITKENFDNLASDLAISKNGFAKAERQLQTVEDKIVKTKITAPTDGTLLNVNVAEGQVVIGAASVNSGTTLMTVADLGRLLLDTYVNQVDVARLKVHQPVGMRVESVREEAMKGEITFIAPVAAIKNGVKGFQVKAIILNPSERLRPGMTVNMSIPVARAQDVLTVPISAIFKGDEEGRESRVVYVVNGPEQTEQREVTVGVSSLDYTEIKSGLKKGERILTVEPRFMEKKS